MTAHAFEKELPEVFSKADHMPSLPAVALEVLRLTQDEDSTIDELATCLSHDPALAAKILKLSNSSLFGMGQETTTLQRATMVLGLKTVKLMSLSFSLVGSLPKSGARGGFDFGEYWRRSLIRSVAARSLARFTGSGLGDEAFLCGLLAHFGRLVMAQVLPQDYGILAEQEGGWPSPESEESAFGFTSSDLCATLLKDWNVPEVIYMASGYWCRVDELPEDSPDEIRELCLLMSLSALTERVLCDQEKGSALAALNQQLAECNGHSAAEVDAFLIGLESGITETADMLSVQLPCGKSHEEIMNEARQQIVAVSLGQAAQLQRTSDERDRLAFEKERLKEKATTDKLTGLPNRAFFDEFLEAQILQRTRERVPLSLGLVMIDIDHFKKFNDTHGHQAGDAVLAEVGRLLSQSTRKGDVAARYGGEEFAVIAPHTNPYNLRAMAERLRTAIEGAELSFDGTVLKVTASFGGACISEFESEKDLKALVKLADSLLYRSKENGRNCCEVYKKIRFPGR